MANGSYVMIWDNDDSNWVKGVGKAGNLATGYTVSHGINPSGYKLNEASYQLMNCHRVPFVIGGHPNIITRTAYISDSDGAQTNVSIVGTVASGAKIVLTSLNVNADGANTVSGGVAVKLGFGSSTIPADSPTGSDKIVFDHKGINAGSSVTIGNGNGIIGIGGDGEELRLTCEDPLTGGISITINYYTIES
jgi:hypothetical protein